MHVIDGRSAGSMEFAFDCDMREYYRIHRAVAKNQVRPWLLRLVIWLASGLVVGTFALSVLLSFTSGYDLLLDQLPWVLLMLVSFGVIVWGAPWLAARTHHKRNQGGHRMILSLEGVKSSSATVETEFKWQGIDRVVETDEFFLLYYTRNCALFLPKGAIQTSEEVDRVRAFLYAQVKDGEIRTE